MRMICMKFIGNGRKAAVREEEEVSTRTFIRERSPVVRKQMKYLPQFHQNGFQSVERKE